MQTNRDDNPAVELLEEIRQQQVSGSPSSVDGDQQTMTIQPITDIKTVNNNSGNCAKEESNNKTLPPPTESKSNSSSRLDNN